MKRVKRYICDDCDGVMGEEDRFCRMVQFARKRWRDKTMSTTTDHELCEQCATARNERLRAGRPERPAQKGRK